MYTFFPSVQTIKTTRTILIEIQSTNESIDIRESNSILKIS